MPKKDIYRKNPGKYKEKTREYYYQNRDLVLEKSKEYCKQNKQKLKEKRSTYYKKNTKRIKENVKKWRKNNPEKLQAQRKKFREADPERIKSYNKKYIEKNTDSRKNTIKKYYEKNRETIALGHKIRSETLKIEVFTEYCWRFLKSPLPKCFCGGCGEYRIEFLTIDHKVPREELGHDKKFSGKALYRWAKEHDYPPTLQILCFNCNTAKGLFSKCPHQNS